MRRAKLDREFQFPGLGMEGDHGSLDYPSATTWRSIESRDERGRGDRRQSSYLGHCRSVARTPLYWSLAAIEAPEPIGGHA